MGAYSRRDFLRGSLAAGAGMAAVGGWPSIITAQSKEPIKIGVLHSLSGTMAISEVSLRDVVLMAVEEINASMEEMSASAEELSQIAGELQADVGRFRTDEDADAAPAPVATIAVPRVVDLRARSSVPA